MALTNISNIFKINDTKFLKLFVDRLLPDKFKSDYPKYEKLIEYFFQYLDEGNTANEDSQALYNLITNSIDYFDLDYINENLTDTTLGENLLYAYFETFAGSKESRFLSQLMNQILYLKKQKTITLLKGTKFAFLIFFLLVLGGYFHIENVTDDLKYHNGVFRYDGTITYNSTEGMSEPFLYLVFSDLPKTLYETILNLLNPAGCLPITFQQQQKIVNAETGQEYSEIIAYTDVYMAIYNNDNFIGLVKPYDIQNYNLLSNDADDYDLLLQNGNKYNEGSDENILFSSVFNTYDFSGTFNRVLLVRCSGLTEYSYNYIETGMIDSIFMDTYLDENNSYIISDNTEINIMLDFQ